MSSHPYSKDWSYWSSKSKEPNRLKGQFLTVSSANHRCGDEVFFELEVDNNSFKRIGFNSKGCSICMGTSAFLSSYLEGKPLASAEIILNEIEKIIEDNSYKSLNADIELFTLLQQFPTRIGCVLLNTKTLLKFIKAILNSDK